MGRDDSHSFDISYPRLALGIFICLAGLLLVSSDGPARAVGLPLMLIGIAIPLFTLHFQRRAKRASREAHKPVTERETGSASGQVYEIQSWRYASPGSRAAAGASRSYRQPRG
jgi:hypothetical protein